MAESEAKEKKGAKDLPEGGNIHSAGSAQDYETGDWRSQRPEVDQETCIDCLQCWIFCPDDSIIVEDEEMKGFKFSHCKGCGICCSVCPVDAITMEEEGK